jgi:UDP-glucose 4-epimerase
MKVLITGGCGFIGVNLVKFLSEMGFTVRVVDNLSVGKNEYLKALSLPKPPQLIVEDIRNKEAMDEAVNGMDAVVHLAAHTSVVESLENPEEDWDINVNGTLNVLEACRRNGVEKFIFASSNAVVGEQEPPIDETVIPRPLSPYGASKLAGEALCSTYYHSFGLKTTSLRFANCYGPFSDHKSSVISRFIDWAKEGKPLIIYGDGNQTRDFVHANDVCQAIYLALTGIAPTQVAQQSEIAQGSLPLTDSYGEVFQIASGVETSINELARLMADIVRDSAPSSGGSQLKVIHEPERVGEIRKNYSNIAKARKVLGFKPKVELHQGLQRLWASMQRGTR